MFVETREETRADVAGIASVEAFVFGRTGKAELVDRLRAEGAVITSLELKPGMLRGTASAVRYAASFGLKSLGLERAC